jgi:hypothetical protein
MRQLLDSDVDLLVRQGSLYVPLCLDPAIAGELATVSGEGDGPLAAAGGVFYLQAMSLASLAANYATMHPEAGEELDQSCLGKYRRASAEDETAYDPKLALIIFEILPHFIKIKAGRQPGKPGKAEILEVVGRRLGIDPAYYRWAAGLYGPDFLRRKLRDLENIPAPGGPPADGLVAARQVRTWLAGVVAGQVLDREKERLRELLAAGEASLAGRWQFLALQRYIADHGGLELDGFGLIRRRDGKEYLIYKRTGVYALMDFYGRTYRFPDCRVAVATHLWPKPVVLERYKHPMLRRQEAGQEICIRQFSPEPFGAASAIKALEEGISALYYGYNWRRRNGYHSLDRVNEYHRGVDFADYVIPRDDPRLLSGELKVTNAHT